MEKIKINSRSSIRNFIQNQQDKIDSWNMSIPYIYFSDEERQQINVMIMILKMLLINTKDVLYAINTLNRENNTVAMTILYKTLIENTIDIRYSLKYYQEATLEEVEKVIDKSERSLYGKSVFKKAKAVFLIIKDKEGKETTLIYQQYQATCKVAHPDFEQLYNILRNKSKRFSPELVLELNVNDKIYSKKEHKEVSDLKMELVTIINNSINEFAQEVTIRHKSTDEVVFSNASGFLTPELTEKGVQTYSSITSKK